MNEMCLLIAGLLALAAVGQNTEAKPYYLMEVDRGKGIEQYLTLLSPESAFGKGLPPEAIIGSLLQPNGRIVPDNFARNRIFVDFMHKIIEREGPQTAEIQKQTSQLKSGNLLLIDDRAPQASRGAPQSEEVVGTFAVAAGRIVSYVPNREHRILSSKGLFRLPFGLQDKLIREMERRANEVTRK